MSMDHKILVSPFQSCCFVVVVLTILNSSAGAIAGQVTDTSSSMAPDDRVAGKTPAAAAFSFKSITTGGPVTLSKSQDFLTSASTTFEGFGGAVTSVGFSIANINRIVNKAGVPVTFSFTPSAGGALAPSNTITLTYPSGFFAPSVTPSSVALSGVATASSGASGPWSIVLTLASGSIAASTAVTVTLGGMTMGTTATAGGDVTVSTSQDLTISASIPSGHIGGAVTSVGFSIASPDRVVNQANVPVMFSFTPSAGGALQPACTVTLNYPTGFFASGVTPTVTLSGATFSPDALSGMSSIVLTLASGSVAASAAVTVTLVGMTMGNTATAGGNVTLSTSQDLLPSASTPSGSIGGAVASYSPATFPVQKSAATLAAWRAVVLPLHRLITWLFSVGVHSPEAPPPFLDTIFLETTSPPETYTISPPPTSSTPLSTTDVPKTTPPLTSTPTPPAPTPTPTETPAPAPTPTYTPSPTAPVPPTTSTPSPPSTTSPSPPPLSSCKDDCNPCCCPGCHAINGTCYTCAAGSYSSDCLNHVQSSCSVCPSGFFCPDGASQPSECPSGTRAGQGATDASQCAAVAALSAGALAAIIACIVVADAVHAWFFVRRKGLKISDFNWILTSLIFGPLVWLIHKRVSGTALAVPLLSSPHQSLQIKSISIDSSVMVNILPRVTSHDIKINKHVKEKRGGGGTVHQVTWKGNPNYAMKKPHFTGAMTARDEGKFVKELESQAQLQHPNCVRVYAVCLEKNNVFIVMEWMHGGSLWERLLHTREEVLAAQQGGASTAAASSGLGLSARKRLEIAREICDGLQCMHSKGMVHGDIKSLNVLLGKDGNAKLCDFGLTTMGLATTAATNTSSGGTAAWSAPEILCLGQRHTPQTDMYALGVVMWELLTCSPPFEGLTPPQIMGQLNTNQRPAIPHPIPSGFPAAYVAMMSRCWDQDPAKRPSAAEVHQCLIDLDPSTQPNEPVELYAAGFCWNAREKSILPCLSRALPSACCRPMLRAFVAAAEARVQSQGASQAIASFRLTPLEAHSIFVYTADAPVVATCHSHGAPFRSYNSTLRDGVAHDVGLWRDYSFLLYSALMKLPSQACVVYRGLNVPLTDISHLYWEGGYVWLRSPTSTTTDKSKTMKAFGRGALGASGTFMELRVTNAKEVEHFSAFPLERELLIPHNTCFKVLGAFSAAKVRLLEGFGALPPNVDLVVVEEVRAAAACVVCCCQRVDASLQVTQGSADYAAALQSTRRF